MEGGRLSERAATAAARSAEACDMPLPTCTPTALPAWACVEAYVRPEADVDVEGVM